MPIPLAARVSRLGTETAFAVSLEASQWAAKGNKVYPFHLGDLNLPTPKAVMDGAIEAMKSGKTGYCPTAGIPQLREALAEEIGRSHGMKLTADNVAIQPGGKPCIGKFLAGVMNPGDKVLYPNPGFPIYESQIEFQGGEGVPYGFVEGAKGFELDMEAIRKGFKAGTKILIYNNYHNPTGASSPKAEMEELAQLCVKNNVLVLSDEAYFDVRYDVEPMSIASLPGMAERTCILYTFSKKFAMTGWRCGAMLGPADFIKIVATMNVNDESCTNHFVQYGALAGLKAGDEEPLKMLAILKQRRDALVPALNAIPGIRCYCPDTTFYLFPNVTEALKRKGFKDTDELRKAALHETGLSFCTRVHFGRRLPTEKDHYIRLAYSGINLDQIQEAMDRFAKFLK
jgi:aspartate/methionine/tyrosine aminotransferase